MSLNQTCKPWSGAALAATELAPDVQQHDKGNEEQAEHEHRRRPTAHAKARGSSVDRNFAQGSSLPPLCLQPPRCHQNRMSTGRSETRLASPDAGRRSPPPRRRKPWRPPQQLRGPPPPQPSPPPGRGAHLQARRVVGVEAQDASALAAAGRPARRRRLARRRRTARDCATGASRARRAAAARPLRERTTTSGSLNLCRTSEQGAGVSRQTRQQRGASGAQAAREH